MTDPRIPANSANSDAEERQRQRASVAETLQQALHSIGASGGAGASGLTPEALQELARRAGIPATSQGELARMIGAATPASGTSSEPQHIVFALHDLEFALPTDAVQAVERVTDIAVVPNTASWVLGIVHLRGSIVSVVDLRAFLGLPAQAFTQRSRLLLTNAREMTLGLMVDGITEMRSLEDQSVRESQLPEWASSFAQRGVAVEGRSIIVLDPARLLFSEKMQLYRADPAQ
jgi:purine-binding chemotaxis protein CheW